MLTGTTARIENPLDFDIGKVCFYLFLFFALFLLIDPFYTGYGAFRVTRDIGPLKYTAVFFGLAAVLFILLGQAIYLPKAKRPPWQSSLKPAMPILILGLYVLTGSSVARLYLNIDETYLQLGIGILGLPMGVIIFWGVKDHMLVIRRLFYGLLLVVPVVAGWVVYTRLNGGQAFHTEMFLFVPLGIYFFLALRQRWLAWLILLIVVALAIVSYKNTAYLILLTMLVQLGLIIFRGSWFARGDLKSVLVIYVLAVLTLLGSASVSYLLANREEYLPSGNVDTRAYTYKAALDSFVASPVYGNAFVETGLTQLDKQVVLGRNTVVTHSDMLDILSNGGLIATTLFILGFVRIGRRVRLAMKKMAAVRDQLPALHGLTSIVLSGLITATFNSPLITLPIAVLFWFSVGLLVAASEYFIRQSSKALEEA